MQDRHFRALRAVLNPADVKSRGQGLLEAQHVFLSGMLAHCAVIAGGVQEALPLLDAAAARGGGVLDLFAAHARAVADRDVGVLIGLVDEFEALGLVTGAVDTLHLVAEIERRRAGVMPARRAELRARALVSEHPPMTSWRTEIGRSAERLSRRELEIVALVRRRMTSREIGRALDISAKTVDNHLASVYRKLGVTGRVELREFWDTTG